MAASNRDFFEGKMADTKRGNYLFKVSEFSPEVREGAVEGTLRIAPVPFISAEFRGLEGDEDALEGSLLGFDLHEGASMEEAKRIAEFLNRNLEAVSITRFGDAEDIAIELDNSENVRVAVERGITEALIAMKDNLAASNLEAATKGVEAVEGWARRLLDDWATVIRRFQ